MVRMILLLMLVGVGGCDDANSSSADMATPGCPPAPRYGGETLAGTACTTPGLRCLYGVEDAIVCVGPEQQWAFCGGVPICQEQRTGAICCGGGCCGSGGQCRGGIGCRCTDADGGT
jgi:hypothetical protein